MGACCETNSKKPIKALFKQKKITIQLLCTNDTHSKLEPYTEPALPNNPDLGGVARRKTAFDEMKA